MITNIYSYIKKQYKKIVIVMLWVLSMFPLFILSFYNHPSADDFNYSAATHQAWLKTHSLIQVFLSAFSETIDKWHTWQGLYSSAFFLSLQPAIFNERMYSLVGIFMVLLISFTIIIFSYYVLYRKLHISKWYSILTALLMSFLIIQKMPDVNEGIYWFNGAINYSFFYCIYIFWICALIDIVSGKDEINLKKTLGVCCLGFVLQGGNHVTAFLGIESCLIAIFFSAIIRKKKNSLQCVIFFTWMICCFLLNVLSPGTGIRRKAVLAEETLQLGVIKTIYLSLSYGMKQISEWLTTDYLIILFCILPLLLYISYRITQNTKFKFNYPLLVAIITGGIHCSMLCPSLYAMGIIGNGRLIDIVYYDFTFVVFFNIIYLGGYLIRHIEIENIRHLLKSNMKWIRQTIIVLDICLILFVTVEYYQNMNISVALDVLKSNQHTLYSDEFRTRDRYLNSTKEKDVEVIGFSATPGLIYRTDITEDVNDWKNRGVAKYYNIRSIKIK